MPFTTIVASLTSTGSTRRNSCGRITVTQTQRRGSANAVAASICPGSMVSSAPRMISEMKTELLSAMAVTPATSGLRSRPAAGRT